MLKYITDKEKEKDWPNNLWAQVICDWCHVWSPKALYSARRAEEKAEIAGFVMLKIVPVDYFGRQVRIDLCDRCSREVTAQDVSRMAELLRKENKDGTHC